GSGMMFVLGVLESKFKPNMSREEGLALAEECIDVAIQRDSGSGNGVNIFVIDNEGVRKVITKRVNTHLQ
ncbi:MAG: proteasome subunit beta, partial [Nanoarchaeota archaeon]|nr:proteasome subunit beta [Nanoarchaeota archaeon]